MKSYAKTHHIHRQKVNVLHLVSSSYDCSQTLLYFTKRLLHFCRRESFMRTRTKTRDNIPWRSCWYTIDPLLYSLSTVLKPGRIQRGAHCWGAGVLVGQEAQPLVPVWLLHLMIA